MAVTKTNLPTYRLQEIFEVRTKLYHDVGSEFHGYSFEADAFHEFVSAVANLLPPSISYEVVERSILHLAGVEITNEVLDEMCWRLAGNLDRLRHGMAVPPWSRQPDKEWVPMQIASVVKTVLTSRSKTTGADVRRRGAWFQYMILGGSSAGRVIQKQHTYEFCHYIKEVMGFSKYDRKRYTRVITNTITYPFADVTELCRLRLFGLIDPAKCKDGPDFSEIANSTSFVQWNREIFRKRQRLKFACPMDYPLDAVPCFRCEIGADRCKAACHPTTYVRKPCDICKKEGWFDPSGTFTSCVDCLAERG
jgi:hypothetical protein